MRNKQFRSRNNRGGIKDCPITSEDIERAEAICGKDIGASKGKSVKTKSAPHVKDLMMPPTPLSKRNDKVTLHTDASHVNGLPFLATISKNIMCRTAEHVIASKKMDGQGRESESDS